MRMGYVDVMVAGQNHVHESEYNVAGTSGCRLRWRDTLMGA